LSSLANIPRREYYRTPRAQHPRSANKSVARSVDLIAQYDSYAMIDLIAPRPLLMITGTEALTSGQSVTAIDKYKGPKELFWIDGASHIDLYDRVEYVPQAVKKLSEFFGEHLGSESWTEALRKPLEKLIG